jgi:hypothetical protein
VNVQLELTNPDSELATLNRIRVETALSRFPIHRLAKKGDINIDLLKLDERGRTDFKWEVTYNVKHGQPGPLAYKVDTLVINRKIDEAERPLPSHICLGSLSKIAQQLGFGGDTSAIKKALHQNASAYVEFSIRYRNREGTEKKLEQGDTRYGVVFAGEKLPGGEVADAVYLILHDWYRELLTDAAFRPLDYDYLSELSPGAQRFYELLSYQMFGAITNGRPRAKLLYSEYCTHAPQTRYPDWEHVRKQMYKVHAPHVDSGYIASVAYNEVTDDRGNRDWEMLYTPGPKASTEHKVFTSRKRVGRPKTIAVAQQRELPLAPGADNEPAIPELTRRGIGEKKARELVAALKPGQEIVDQLEYVDHLISKDRHGKIENPPGLYIHYVHTNITPPAEFWSSRKRQLKQQAHQEKNTTDGLHAKLELEYEAYRAEETLRYIDAMPSAEYERLHQQHLRWNRGTFKLMTAAQIEDLTKRSVESDIRDSGNVPLLSFDAFCQERKS